MRRCKNWIGEKIGCWSIVKSRYTFLSRFSSCSAVIWCRGTVLLCTPPLCEELFLFPYLVLCLFVVFVVSRCLCARSWHYCTMTRAGHIHFAHEKGIGSGDMPTPELSGIGCRVEASKRFSGLRKRLGNCARTLQTRPMFSPCSAHVQPMFSPCSAHAVL